MKKRKKVLIVGARGMLGQALVEVFRDNYQVLAWDKNEIDIANQKQVLEKINEEKPDIIINSAAHNAVDKIEESQSEFELAREINEKGPKNLAEVARKINAVFVHFVSDYIFDGKKGEYSEKDKSCPISKYGQTKAKGEKNVKKIGERFYLIRTSKLFGKPAQTMRAKKSFFETMRSLAEKETELKVVDDERSCFTFTPDLANAVRQLIEKNYTYGVYHLVNEGAVTWFEGLTDFFKIAGIEGVSLIPVKAKEFPRSAMRPKSSVLVNNKFPKLRPYTEALKEWLG